MDDDVKNVVDNISNGSIHKLQKPTGLVKKSPVEKFADTFFAEDFVSFKHWFINELLIKGVKDLIFSSIQRLFYKSDNNIPGTFVSYGSSLVRDYVPSNTVNYNAVFKSGAKTQYKFDFSDLIFRDMPAARDFLNALKANIAQYGKVSVSELYDALDKTGGLDISDSYYGWYNLDAARIIAVQRGFRIDLPQPVQLS